jgi:hypothetical protein
VNAIHILLRISAVNMALHTAIFLPSGIKKRKYNPACVDDEISITDMFSEELDIVSGDEINLENEAQSASVESSNTSSESECESETSIVFIDGWENMTMGDKNSTHTHLLKIQAHNFTFYQIQSLCIILVYF